jgi:hypothetical protein
MMSDKTVANCLRVQGKKAKAIYNYNATMNDEVNNNELNFKYLLEIILSNLILKLNLKLDDMVVLTQSSEDETWFEGTLNGKTGWFPSNYVHILEDDCESESAFDSIEHQPIEQIEQSKNFKISEQTNEEDNYRVHYLKDLKRSEETFLDEMNKFMKTILVQLQTNDEIFPREIGKQINSILDELVQCHQEFFQQLKEIVK